MKVNETEISKYMRYILRHKPEAIGEHLDEHGWLSVDKLIKGINRVNCTNVDMDLIEKIVKEDKKGRYSFNEDKTLIRANQGHSVQVDVELKEVTPPEILYHGTGKKYLESIVKTGLDKRSRLYVHLSKDVDTAEKVGKRHGEPVILKIKTKEMTEDGFKFYISENGVWLTDNVPTRYIEVCN